MNFSEEQLSAVEDMAGLFLSVEMIAANMELNQEDTDYLIAAIECKNMNNAVVSAYYKGWLTAEVELRRAIKQSALNGSSPSQQMMMNYQKESRR